MSFEKRTEACQSVGTESWGYRKDEDYYTDRHLMRSIDKYLARDANYLLNVGPNGDGTIPDESAAILRRIGKWYQRGEGIAGRHRAGIAPDRQPQRAADAQGQYAVRPPASGPGRRRR